MRGRAEHLERQAHTFLSEDNLQAAHKAFREAAQCYCQEGNHKQAALCFASAGSCWSRKCGEKIFYTAALNYENAAKQAEQCRDYHYASLLYKYAAINHERDREQLSFSQCFYRSRELYRRYLTYRLLSPKKNTSIRNLGKAKGIGTTLRSLVLWSLLTFSYIVWGHGERPLRTFFLGIGITIFCGVLYTFGALSSFPQISSPNFLQALYFSIITFTTVGYGDIVPVGYNKLIAAAEAFSGLFLMPIFIIGLSRRYLRI